MADVAETVTNESHQLAKDLLEPVEKLQDHFELPALKKQINDLPWRNEGWVSCAQVENGENGDGFLRRDAGAIHGGDGSVSETPLIQENVGGKVIVGVENHNQNSKIEPFLDGDDSGTEAEQADFMKELEKFHRERSLEFKPPKFYREKLNCLKLWRQVTSLGGYDRVTSCKLWRQVGESFNPPKTCTTISWSFRSFYEKTLLEYEKHKVQTGELHMPLSSFSNLVAGESQNVHSNVTGNQASGTGKARRNAATRAMQGWHAQHLISDDDIEVLTIKENNQESLLTRDEQHKTTGVHKRKSESNTEFEVYNSHKEASKTRAGTMVLDDGGSADWVKINVKRNRNCFEVYALVPGLLRDEIHVKSDAAGQLIITGEPGQPDNPWGVTPFKKVINLATRIDPLGTSAVVTLHGQLFVRAPCAQSDA